jgi:hypothetical protein
MCGQRRRMIFPLVLRCLLCFAANRVQFGTRTDERDAYTKCVGFLIVKNVCEIDSIVVAAPIP